ncbi:PREDICTED: uncharacterized protein LOC109167196 [Ipomoea nil]|uniref:uncharacterized protein LOC109167196 n=1 Tax=Ipomoea nil TaxID=35883 RepID=UPI000900DC65|nr:PREDICTED: uncharacterized protein LOC109167196 [Ipomoea nil]
MEHFDLALCIPQRHGCLIGEQDGDGMTALQLLALNPSAFKVGKKNRFIKLLVNSTPKFISIPLLERIRMKFDKYESALKLAFAATVILMIRNKECWTKIALSSMSFISVTIFAVSYVPLYVSLWKNYRYTFRKLWTLCLG